MRSSIRCRAIAGNCYAQRVSEARASFRFVDLRFERVVESTSTSAVLIADDKAYVAADPNAAFQAFVVFGEWLCEHMQPSMRWRAAHLAVAHGRAAMIDDRRTTVGLSPLTSATDMLNLAREVLGDDAYLKLRDAAASRMLGRS